MLTDLSKEWSPPKGHKKCTKRPNDPAQLKSNDGKGRMPEKEHVRDSVSLLTDKVLRFGFLVWHG
jgi:hypothetical protein